MSKKPPIDRATIASASRASVVDEKKRQEKAKKEKLMGSSPNKSKAVDHTSSDPGQRKTRSSNHEADDTFGSASASPFIDNCRQRSNQALDRTRQFVEPLLKAPEAKRSSKHDNRTHSDKTADIPPQMKNQNQKKHGKLPSQEQGQYQQKQNQTTESDDEQRQQTLNNKNPEKQQKQQKDHQQQKHEQQNQQEPQHNQQQSQEAKNQQPEQQQQQQQQNQQEHKENKQQQPKAPKQQQQQQQQTPKAKKQQQVHVPKAGARLFTDNLEFYQNKIKSKPFPGDTIEDMLKWKGDYGMLERNHRYIQWLFPIPEGNGLNASAQALMDNEAQEMKNDKKIQKRILSAFKMMLDFYGMELKDTNHGVFKRSSKWKERYEHLNRSRHNFLRITRILKSLGELGYERLQAPWVEFLLYQAQTTDELWALNGPCMEHWIGAVKDPVEQAVLLEKRHKWSATQTHMESRNYEMPELSESEDEDPDVEIVGKGDDEEKDKVNSDNNYSQVRVQVESDEESERTVSPGSKRKESEDDEDRRSPTHVIQTKRLKHEDTKKEQSECHKTDEQNMPNKNLLFYRNEILSNPTPGYTIDTMLKHKGDHEFFHSYPCFSQWLFPSPNKSSTNDECQILNSHEAKEIREDSVLSDRVLEAYKTVLDFFGMKLVDDITGKVKRVPETYIERYQYISGHPGNYLRITRVLTSLGELGYERFQVPLIDFLISEGYDNKMFDTLQTEDIEHWIGSIKDDGEKYTMVQKYKKIFDDVHSDDEVEQKMAGLQIKSNSTCDKDMRQRPPQSEQPKKQNMLPTSSHKAFSKERVFEENSLSAMQLDITTIDGLNF